VRGGEAIPPPAPTVASNLQPVLHHAGVAQVSKETYYSVKRDLLLTAMDLPSCIMLA
jgi:hypothetical protein